MLTAGAVILMVGAAVINWKLRLAVPVLPARSVCEAITFLLPSGGRRVTVALHAPAKQTAIDGEMSPVRLIAKPSVQVPVRAMVERVCVP